MVSIIIIIIKYLFKDDYISNNIHTYLPYGSPKIKNKTYKHLDIIYTYDIYSLYVYAL